MLDWIYKKQREKKRKDAHERALKKTIAEKIARYEKNNESDEDEFTEVAIEGKKVRVAKEQITINGIWSGQHSKTTK